VLKRCALFLSLLLTASWLQANVYYANKGTKYHIGDDRASASVDSDFLDTYPVVGAEWKVGFTVNKEDTVKVHIDEVWGVDDCPYCKIMIDIDGREMGRMFEEDNHKSYDTPGPLAMHVVPGHTYTLRISSRNTQGGKALDDMAFQGVSVITDAELTYVTPPTIGEEAPPPPKASPCEGAKAVEHWLPAMDQGRAMSEFKPADGDALRQASASVPDSSYLSMQVKVEESGRGALVDQYLEVLMGAPASGWILSFAPGSIQPKALNTKLGGRYKPKTFTASGWRSGWNELRVARCPDGTARIWINGTEQGARIQGLPSGDLPLSYRSAGLGMKVAEKAF
jgi:hypothetical protein